MIERQTNSVKKLKTMTQIKNSTGCFVNDQFKTAVVVKNGQLLASFTYGRNINNEMIQIAITESSNWIESNEYVYVTPDPIKGWNQPASGLKHITAVEWLPKSYQQRVITIESFINSK